MTRHSVRLLATAGAAVCLAFGLVACADEGEDTQQGSEADGGETAGDGTEASNRPDIADALEEGTDTFTIACVGLYEAWMSGDEEAAAAFASTTVVDQLFALEVKTPSGLGIAAAEPDCIFDNVDEYVDVGLEGDSEEADSSMTAVAIEVTARVEASPELIQRFEDARSSEG